MHHAKLNKSDRLQRVLKLLEKSIKPQSTRQIIKKANVCAVNSIVSELRENHRKIRCQRVKNVWFYSLVGANDRI